MSPITVTFILKDVSDSFLTELEGLPHNGARFEHLRQHAQGDLRHLVKMKIGTGQFRAAVELNSMLRRRDCTYAYNLGARRGYRLATFTVNRGT